ncbi:hypothetical protein [Nocardia sp. CC227C]|uniref:hypothetical protein n=1 Tax=Nocardia sp. CC227C TaxID=3044562 RepID=UPI00278BD9E6|nr:hypothetical protein [Nocardia sp. CC227C]
MAMPSSKFIGAGTPNIAVTGGVLVAPLASTLPTSADGAIDAAFKALGYVSEDGIESMGERRIESVKDWNADIITALRHRLLRGPPRRPSPPAGPPPLRPQPIQPTASGPASTGTETTAMLL